MEGEYDLVLSDLVGLWLEEDSLCERPTVFHAKRVLRPNKCRKFCSKHKKSCLLGFLFTIELLSL